jgi:hypothetical protein
MVDGPWDTTRCIFVAAFGDIAGRGIAGMPVFHKLGIILNGSAWAKRFSRARTVWADYVASMACQHVSTDLSLILPDLQRSNALTSFATT